MTRDMIPDADLDLLFAQARQTGPAPSAGLQARVLDDALSLAAPPRAEPGASGPGLGAVLDWLLGLFGGAGVMAGAVTAGLAGLAMGYMQPAALEGFSGYLGLQGTASVAVTEEMELMPGLDALLGAE